MVTTFERICLKVSEIRLHAVLYSIGNDLQQLTLLTYLSRKGTTSRGAFLHVQRPERRAEGHLCVIGGEREEQVVESANGLMNASRWAFHYHGIEQGKSNYFLRMRQDHPRSYMLVAMVSSLDGSWTLRSRSWFREDPASPANGPSEMRRMWWYAKVGKEGRRGRKEWEGD